jgi:transposase
MNNANSLDNLDAQQLRALAANLRGELAARDAQIADKDRELHFKQTHIDQLTQELAL